MIKLIIFFFMLGMNYSQKETIKSVELSYQTRGMQKFLFITSDTIEVKINDKINKYKTTKAQWQRITKTFDTVKLSGISKIKRPSTKSFHDGAMMAQLKIVTNLKEYESVGFDHDLPPTALVKTINAMKATLGKNDF
jgi:hypothetical protein